MSQLPANPAAAALPRFSPWRLIKLTLLSATIWCAVMAGCAVIGPWGIDASPASIGLRMDRLIPASLVGVALSAAGVALQSLLRNPLASPSILGISSGATVGAMLAMLLGPAWAMLGLSGMGLTTLGAAVGGLATIVVVYLVAQRGGLLDPYTLLLTGVILSAFNGAIIMFLYLVSSQPVFRDAAMWAMGSIRAQSDWQPLVLAAAVILGGWLVLLNFAKAFNVQALGEDVAGTSGVNVHRLRIVTFTASALMTAAAVALSGPIAFVGLIVPHVTRRIFGPDHRILLVTAGFLGAAFLAAADTLCRSLVWLKTGELPLGIITAATGGPFFLMLLRQRMKEQA